MNAALIGSVSSSVATLNGMIRGGLEVSAVLGLHKRHAERVSDYHDLEPLAKAADLPFLAFDKVTEPAVYDFLKAHQPDWLFVIGLSQLVPADLRAIARAGAVGFHPTMLPEGRGRAPVAWTILLNRPAAANLFWLTNEADAGDIIAQRPVDVLPDDYSEDLIARTNNVLEQMVADLAPAFASGDVPRIPQDHAKATTYAKRTPGDGLIDWHASTDAVYRLVRAAGRPYPGAFTIHDGRKIIIWRARPIDAPMGASEAPREPGTVIDIRGGGPVVRTRDGATALTELQGADGQPVRLEIGDRLG